MKKQREVWKGRRSLIRVGTLNIGTMTGRGRELADMMERRNVDILCLQEIKWKGSKARNNGGGCKLFYNAADGRKNGIGIVLREDLAESVLKVKRVSDRLDGHEGGGKRVHPKYSKRVYPIWSRKIIFGKTWMG